MLNLDFETFFMDYMKISLNNSILSSVNLGNECKQQLQIFTSGIQNHELWAWKMLDASSKVPAGILDGNLKDVGMYNECVETKVTKKSMEIVGQHCMYSLSIQSSESWGKLEPNLAICTPNKCNNHDIKNLLQFLVEIDRKKNNETTVMGVNSVACSHDDAKSWNEGSILTMIILGAVVLLLVICTISDWSTRTDVKRTRKNKFLNSICKFSLCLNGKRILSMVVPNENLSAISGMRFLSMCYVVLGHTYHNEINNWMINRMDPLKWVRSWSAISLLVGIHAVDTFLVISGILVSYFFLKANKNGAKLNLIRFYTHRWLRLSSILGVLLVLTIFILPKLGSGPLWNVAMNFQSESCARNWWRILLYIQNYGTSQNLMCLGYTWYLAVDMQLFWISPLILYPIARRPRLGMKILGVFVLASVIIPAAIGVTKKYSWSTFFTLNDTLTADMMFNFYVPTYTRAGPYLFGIFVGYLLAEKKLLARKIYLTIGWIVTAMAFAFSAMSWRIFQNINYKYNLYWELFYTGFSQHIWAFGVCWIIYVSAIGHGGFINSFLSARIFIPISRISYSIYLLHFVIQTMRINAERTPVYFSNFEMFNIFLSDFIITIVCGFFFTLLFESPILILEKMLSKKKVMDNKEIKIETFNRTGSIGIDNAAYEINHSG